MKDISLRAFSLIEFIVISTILGILALIAYTTYEQFQVESANKLVEKNVNSLIAIFEEEMRLRNFDVKDLVGDSKLGALPEGTFAEGIEIIEGENSAIGSVNFEALPEKSLEYRDPTGVGYIAAYVIDPNDEENTFYQIVGQTINKDGSYDAVVKGKYLRLDEDDVDGLVVGAGYPNGVTKNTMRMQAPGIY